MSNTFVSPYYGCEGLPESVVAEVTQELGERLDPDRVLSGPAIRGQYPGDKSWLTAVHAALGQPLNRPDVVVLPLSTREVSQVMELAWKRGIPVTPIAGASGVQGAANANCGGISLDLSQMTAIRSLDRESLACTVEAGMNIKRFEDLLNAQGLSFTHYPASAEWASVGGAVAARGSGVLSTKYGNIQDHVLSLEVVMPDGGTVQLPSVPKHGAGPELTQLFIGSEGTLGIITAVRVKIRPLPAHRRFSAFRFPSLGDGIATGREIMATGLRPAVIRLYDQEAATQSLEKALNAGIDGEAMVLMVDGDHERLVDLESELCDDICAAHGGRKLDPSVGAAWWERRYAFSHPPHAPQLPQIWCTTDFICDYAHINKMYAEVTRAIHESIDPKWGLTLKTHLSHWFEWGVMIYSRFIIPQGPPDLKAALGLHDQVIRAAVTAALESGGIINDHHGVGMRLAAYMPAQFGKAGMDLLRGIKSGVDPQNILCPGKLELGPYESGQPVA